MGLLDIFSLKRFFNPPQRGGMRQYAGAAGGRLNYDWIAGGTSADSEIWGSLRRLRNRSRQLVRDNDYARAALRTIANNVVHTGINFQAQCPKVRGEGRDDRLNSEIEMAWADWAKADRCDVSGRMPLEQIQRLAIRSCIESGEVFIRMVRQSRGKSRVPFALEVIEADQVPEDYQGEHGGNRIRMGIEVDEWNRPVAYWAYPYHPGDYSFNNNDVGKLRRIPADQILHLYISDRPGQTRGVPWMASAMQRLRNLGGYEEAELVAARASASIMGFLQTPDADLIGGSSGDGVESLEPGTVKRLAPGEVFSGFDPSRPNNAFDPFVRLMLRGVAAGIGVSYETLSKDFSQSNYSSSRLSILDDRDYFRVLQNWFVRSFCEPVYEQWLEMAVMSGVINAPDYELRPLRYCQVRWQTRGWSWVDPAKEIKATIDAIDRGLTSLTAEIAKGGGDVEEVFKTKAREEKLAESLGISLNQGNISVDESLRGFTFVGIDDQKTKLQVN